MRFCPLTLFATVCGLFIAMPWHEVTLFVHFAELSSQELVVDVCEEDRMDDMNVKLSSFQISPITSSNVLNADGSALTEDSAKSDHSYSLTSPDKYHPNCDETNGKQTVDDDDGLV